MNDDMVGLARIEKELKEANRLYHDVCSACENDPNSTRLVMMRERALKRVQAVRARHPGMREESRRT